MINRNIGSFGILAIVCLLNKFGYLNIEVHTLMILIILVIVLDRFNNNIGEHMTNTDPEAAQIVASMYNAEDKTLKLTNLEVTGNIKATGDIEGKTSKVQIM